MQVKNRSDQEILDLFRKDSSKEEAFKILMHQNQEKIYAIIRNVLHSHFDTNDVLQNTFIKAYRYLGDFKGESAISTWLYRIATNECYNFLRKKNKRKEGSLDEQASQFGEQLKSDPYFDGDEWEIELAKAVDQLPEKQKMVFNLRYFQEMKYAEISKVLDTSEGALKASFHHAVKKIEQSIRQNV